MAAPSHVAHLVASLAADPGGLRLLANALDSQAEGLVDAEFVRNLLHDVADHLAAQPAWRWGDALSAVCRGKASPLRRAGGYHRAALAAAPAPAAPAMPGEWSTVVSAHVWFDKHLEKRRPRATPWPIFPPADNQECRRRFEACIGDKPWIDPPTGKEGAWLGRPATVGANCWISSVAPDTGYNIRAADLGQRARQVIEALGILPANARDCLVRYALDAAASGAQADARRPSFAEGGNEWFRVRPGSARARSYAAQGWGCTVNLSILRSGRGSASGRPEQVVPSVALAEPLIRRVELLFPRNEAAGFGSKPHAAFDKSLFLGRSAADIEGAVLQLWRAAPSPTPVSAP